MSVLILEEWKNISLYLSLSLYFYCSLTLFLSPHFIYSAHYLAHKLHPKLNYSCFSLCQASLMNPEAQHIISTNLLHTVFHLFKPLQIIFIAVLLKFVIHTCHFTYRWVWSGEWSVCAFTQWENTENPQVEIYTEVT